jgi:hypothetical protein
MLFCFWASQCTSEMEVGRQEAAALWGSFPARSISCSPCPFLMVPVVAYLENLNERRKSAKSGGD